ncbi:MAG: NAD(P)/FAD-dependent oxidoreductase [Rhodocyclales bacterium GT-UBC]|nr:MAG: NAD(P)/FAD-dependent oxidoreductase [Rhodocyclales bacterium GT-UBC]
MSFDRRQFLLACAALGTTPWLRAGGTRPRVVVIGGGWGGLSAARHLAGLCDVVLVERNARFISLPLANRVLAGVDDGRRLHQDYQAAADAFHYRFLHGTVQGIERERRQVVTSQGPLAYDWLIVAAGIGEDDALLVDGNTEAARHLRRHFASANTPGEEIRQLQEKLAGFNAGEFLINVPPAPYRCPPAPYERAVIVAHAIKSRQLKAHLTLIDPNAPWPGYQRIFHEFFREQVTYLPNTRLRQLDPYARRVSLDFDDLKFDEAILMPPQAAAPLCRAAGLTDPGSAWAAVDPRRFTARDDERVFVIGDSVGAVSPVFGHYPKTGQLAARMGEIVAGVIARQIAGESGEPPLPDSTCFAYLHLAPPRFTRIETRYRLRGDGVLLQQIQQQQENNPQGENDAWLDAWHGSLFGQGRPG